MNQLKRRQGVRQAVPVSSQKKKDIWFTDYSGNCAGDATGNYGDAILPAGYTTAQAELDGTTPQETATLLGLTADSCGYPVAPPDMPNPTVYSAMSNTVPTAFSVCLGGTSGFPVPSSSVVAGSQPTFYTLGPWTASSSVPQLFMGSMTSNASGVFTVPASGTYLVNAQISYSIVLESQPSNIGFRAAQLLLTRTNPSTGATTTYVIASEEIIPSANVVYDSVLHLQTLGQFIRGDTLALQTAQNSSYTLTVAPGVSTQWNILPIPATLLNTRNVVSVAH